MEKILKTVGSILFIPIALTFIFLFNLDIWKDTLEWWGWVGDKIKGIFT